MTPSALGPALNARADTSSDPDAVTLIVTADVVAPAAIVTSRSKFAVAPAAIVLAAEGYPINPRLGDPITGTSSVDGAYLHHAGTALKDGVLHSAGGRVLSVTAIGESLTAARLAAYEAISKITLRGAHYRHDIALAASAAPKVREN